MPSYFVRLADRYATTAAVYLAPTYRPRHGSLKLDILAHARKLSELHRSALLLALVWQGSPAFTPAHAQQVARFCPS